MADWLFIDEANELFIKVKYTLDEQFYNKFVKQIGSKIK